MQKIFHSRWRDTNDLGWWDVMLYPNDYKHQSAMEERIELPPSVFVINENEISKFSKYNRVGMSDIPIVKLNVSLSVLDSKNEGHKDFVKTILGHEKEVTVPEVYKSENFIWNNFNLGRFNLSNLKRHNLIKINKSYGVLDPDMSVPALEFTGIQEVLTGGFELKKDIAFDVTFHSALGYALSNINFKAAWSIAASYLAQGVNYKFDYPFAFLYHNTNTDGSNTWDGQGKDNVAGSIVYCPIPQSSIPTNKKSNSTFGTLVINKIYFGYTIEYLYKEMITFTPLLRIFNHLVYIINNYLKIIAGFTINNIPPLIAKYYKQKYDNSGDIGDEVRFDALYIPVRIIDTKGKIVFDYIEEDNKIFDKLDYQSISDFLQDLYFADGQCVYYENMNLVACESFVETRQFEIDNTSTEISIELNINEFENIRSGNVEFYDTDITNKELNKGNVGTSEGVNLTNIFHTQPTNNVNTSEAMRMRSIFQAGLVKQVPGTDTYGYAGLNENNRVSLGDWKVHNLWLTNNISKEMHLQLFYIDQGQSWMHNNQKIPFACHHFVGYEHINGIKFNDWKISNNEVGKLRWGQYNLGWNGEIVNMYEDDRYKNALPKINDYFFKIQNFGCSHTFSALAIQRSFGNPINKFTIKISYNDFLKQNKNIYLPALLYRKISITFKENWFSEVANFDGDYWVVNYKYDVSKGDLILDVINKNYGG